MECSSEGFWKKTSVRALIKEAGTGLVGRAARCFVPGRGFLGRPQTRVGGKAVFQIAADGTRFDRKANRLAYAGRVHAESAFEVGSQR